MHHNTSTKLLRLVIMLENQLKQVRGDKTYLGQFSLRALYQHAKPLWHIVGAGVNVLVQQELSHDIIVLLVCIKLLLRFTTFIFKLLAHDNIQAVELVDGFSKSFIVLLVVQGFSLVIEMVENAQDLIHYV